MKDFFKILIPKYKFTISKNNTIDICGVTKIFGCQKIKIIVGDNTDYFSTNSAGEFQTTIFLSNGLHKIRIYHLLLNGNNDLIKVKYIYIIKNKSRYLLNKSNNKLKQILPSGFFNKSENGITLISGVFRDSFGNPADSIIIKIGKRVITFVSIKKFEFTIPIKTGKGFKFFRIYAKAKNGKLTLVGYRLFLVSPAPKISLSSQIEPEEYNKWIDLYEKPSPAEKIKITTLISQRKPKPKIGIILNGKSPFSDLVTGTIKSVIDQYYTNWKLFITSVDTSSYDDNRVKSLQNRLISQDSVQFNFASTKVDADFLIFLTPKDRLSPYALVEYILTLGNNPETKILYGDDDHIHLGGYRTNPHFKSKLDKIRLLNLNYIGEVFFINQELFNQLGGFSEDELTDPYHDFLSRATVKCNSEQILHIPRVLTHRVEILSQNNIFDNKKRELTLKRNIPNKDWHLCNSKGLLRLIPKIDQDKFVSIIIPSACKLEYLKPCINSILNKTYRTKFEILLIVNEIRLEKAEIKAYLDDLTRDKFIQVIQYKNQPFNYSKIINLGVTKARADNICFLNDDIEVISREWLDELVSWLLVDSVGAVGARLLYPDKSIQHAGVAIGVNGMADHLEKGKLREDAGDFARILFPRELFAITGGCMVVRKDVFEQISGFDENLAEAFNDVDFCIRLQQNGFKVVFNPFAELIHHESVSVDKPYTKNRKEIFRKEMNVFLKKHNDFYEDPYYSSNYSNLRPYFRLAHPPRKLAPWKEINDLSWKRRKPLRLFQGQVKYSSDKVIIFSHFDKDNIIDPYVQFCLNEMHKIGWVIIFVTSCHKLAKNEIAKIEQIVCTVILSDGNGRDWGNYALGFRFAYELAIPSKLILMNDSVYGPFHSIKNIFKKADSFDADFWGLTDSPQHRYHLQSYFLYFKPSICLHQTFINYWESFIPQPNKDLIIERNEIDFSQHFINLGFNPAALYPYSDLVKIGRSSNYAASSLLKKNEHVNPSHYFWDILLVFYKFPFIKVELLRDNPSQIPGIDLVRDILKEINPEVSEQVSEHLKRVSVKNLNYNLKK